jgi:hypothetical protein
VKASDEPWPSYLESSWAVYASEVARLRRDVPAFAAACDNAARPGVGVASPEVAIFDPKGHPIVPVRLYVSEQGAPQLWVSRGPLKDGLVENGWANRLNSEFQAHIQGTHYPLVHIACLACPYRGDWRQEQLLGLYAKALTDRSLEIHLPP